MEKDKWTWALLIGLVVLLCTAFYKSEFKTPRQVQELFSSDPKVRQPAF